MKKITIAALSIFCIHAAQASVQQAELPPALCKKDFNSFEAWLEDFRVEAFAKGVTQETWDMARHQLQFDSSILARDQQQGGFYKNFLEFSIPRSHRRIAPGRQILQKNAELFKAIEARFGVSAEVLVAFWGMETDFALKQSSQYPVVTSMATLAYDCRRSALFRQNLLHSLLLIEQKVLPLSQMKGQWAGEMSGLQFTPSNYYNFAIDFDGDNKRDMLNSLGDLMGSAARIFKDFGWKAGQPYLIEVKVPQNLPWQDADLTLVKMNPVSVWSQYGVTTVDGAPLPFQGLNAALMLPMGRLGPTFLAFDNFKTLLLWNASLNNALTAGYLASRIRNPHLKDMRRGNGNPEVLSSAQLIELQTLLQKKGYNVGKIDGFLGTQTRIATRDLQIKWGLPADAYPTSEVLNRLRSEVK